jgi:probable F420-dependent oxidoreductase
VTSDLRLGFGLPVSGSWATPGNVAAVARRAEELGYGSLWTFQRVVVPVDDDYGPQYRSVLDPVVALGFAAAVTSDVRLGTAVVNAPFLPPAILAKQLASVDVLSRGRVDVGLGLGWAPHEFEAIGAPYERRGARLTDYVACLRALWADDPVSFSGDFFRVPPARMLPKPVQRPAPPILLGGTADPALRRAGRIADGWISGSRQDLRAVTGAIATIRGAAEAAGRDPAALRIVVRGVLQLGDDVRSDDGQRGADPRRPWPAARGGRHRGLPRSQLQPAGRLARCRPDGRRGARARGAGDVRPGRVMRESRRPGVRTTRPDTRRMCRLRCFARPCVATRVNLRGGGRGSCR